MGKIEDESPYYVSWDKEKVVWEDLAMLEHRLDDRSLMVRSLNLDTDGEIQNEYFFPPIEKLFHTYLKKSGFQDYQQTQNQWVAFREILDRYAKNKTLTNGVWITKFNVFTVFRNHLRGFLNYLNTEGSNQVLQEYFESWKYVFDYADLRREIPNLIEPRFKYNTYHAEKAVPLVRDLQEKLVGFSPTVLDIGHIWGRVARSDVQIDVYADDKENWGKKKREIIEYMQTILGPPWYIPDERDDHITRPQFRFVSEEGLSCQILLKHISWLDDTQRILHLLRFNPDLVYEYDEALLDEVSLYKRFAVPDYVSHLFLQKHTSSGKKKS